MGCLQCIGIVGTEVVRCVFQYPALWSSISDSGAGFSFGWTEATQTFRPSVPCRSMQRLQNKFKVTLAALNQPAGSPLAWMKFIEHGYSRGKIPNGYLCKETSDCLSSPYKGHCYPGPPNNENKYCIDRDSNCALPGTSGTLYGAEIDLQGQTFQCFKPTSGPARWRLSK